MNEVKSFKRKKVAFIHPDLGIGGAERLVVDAALGLQNLDNEVIIFTSHCDRSHCFEEIANEQVDVNVMGDFLPINILGKFHIFFAILRQFYLILKLIWSKKVYEYDYYIVDQLSFCIPLLNLFSRNDSRILFYCHFPDQLLVQRGGMLKQCYRAVFDYIEEWTTGCSDKIVVNSHFTKSIFFETFHHLRHVSPEVIYPCVDVDVDVHSVQTLAYNENENTLGNRTVIISINRFEKKKNVELALESFAEFMMMWRKGDTKKVPLLIIAGGYDHRVAENVAYMKELQELGDQMKMKSLIIDAYNRHTFESDPGRFEILPEIQVVYMPSVKSSVKEILLKNSELLLYTPTFEHFGIVPVESMLYETPPLVVNYGGPTESVVDVTLRGVTEGTGYIRPPDKSEWAKVIYDYTQNLDDASKKEIKSNGNKRVHNLFLRTLMANAFQNELVKSSIPVKHSNCILKLASLWRMNLSIILLMICIAISYK